MSDKDQQLADAVQEFINGDSNLAALRKMSAIFQTDPTYLEDPDLIKTLIDNSIGKEKPVLRSVAKMAQSHIRSAVANKQTAMQFVNEITGMKKTTFYKSSTISHTSGNSSISDKDKARMEIINHMFLEQNLPDLRTTLGKEWDDANRVSYAEFVGLTEDALYSLGKWHIKLAEDSRNNLEANTAQQILGNLTRINGILERKNGHTVTIPSFLYDNAGIEAPRPNHA